MSKTERIIVWSDKTMAFSFYALIYFLPISIALTETFSGLAIFCYLIKRGVVFYQGLRNIPSDDIYSSSTRGKIVLFLQSFKPGENYLNKPFAIFLLINFITIFTGQNAFTSFEGFMGKILQGTFIFFTFFECMRSTRRLKIFLIVFAVSTLLICANGFYQYFTGRGFIYGHVFDGRISSSFRHANDYAAYLVIITSVLFYLSVFASFISGKMHGQKEGLSPASSSFLTMTKTKILLFMLFVACFVSLGLTYSRGAWVAFVLCVLWGGSRNWKSFVVSFLIAIVFLSLFYPKLNKMRSPITDSYTFVIYNNRLEYWSRSIRIIKDYPFLGSGLNTYSSVQWRYDVGWGGYPHNSYLQMAAETGVLGLSSFLWLLFVLYKNSFRNLGKTSRPELKFLLMSFLAGLSGFLLHSFFDTNFYSVQLSSLLWLMMGLIVSLQYMGKANHEIPPVPPIR